jgi:hypothetical protein
MCNRVAHIKEASLEEILTLIDCLHEDNLPVQPVAQRAGIKRLKKRLATAWGLPKRLVHEAPDLRW